MIEVHRLGHHSEAVHVNPDLIQTVEAHPDSVITLTTGHSLVVNESPEEILEAVRDWRVSLLSEALKIAA
jgi:flagellar protein FlbD